MSNGAIQISIRTYKFRTANKIITPLRIFRLSEPLTPLCGNRFEKRCFVWFIFNEMVEQ